MSQPYTPTPRTRVVREAHRAVYDRETVYRILDEGFLCHVGFVADGQPFVIPTSYGRKDASLYIHGSAASRMLRQMKDGVPVCITVTLLDGLVLARSIFNHSMNYRSVVVLGKATLVDDPEEKLDALRTLSEHILPGRWDDARQPNERELKADLGSAIAHRRILSEGAPRPGHRRRRRLFLPDLGGSCPAGNDCGHADRRFAARSRARSAGIRA